MHGFIAKNYKILAKFRLKRNPGQYAIMRHIYMYIQK